MGKGTSIQWTGHSWPVTTGCDDESPGCLHCYAKPLSYRMGLNPSPKVSGAYGGTVEKRAGVLRWTGLVRTLPDRLDWPFGWKKPASIFVGNMSDLFHPAVPDEFIESVFAVMNLARHHTFQVLTKRAERMADWFSHPLRGFRNQGKAIDLMKLAPAGLRSAHGRWPLPNVHVGVSVEDQKRADERIPHLLRCPAAVRFLSVEPLLQRVDLDRSVGGTRWMGGQRGCAGTHRGDGRPGCPREPHHHHDDRCGPGLDWVIVGGESGRDARPFDLAWARSLRDQCRSADVPFFLKQLGSHPIGPYHERLRMLGNPAEGEDAVVRWKLTDSHGGDMAEWPDDLRVREFPGESDPTCRPESMA